MKRLDKKTKNAWFIGLNLILSVLTMSLCLSVISRVLVNDTDNVSLFIGLAVLSQILNQILLFLKYENKKDKLRILIVCSIYIVAAVLGFLSRSNYVLFYIATFLVAAAMSANQFLTISKEKTKRGFITNILLGVVFAMLAAAVLFSIDKNDFIYISLVSAFLLLFSSLRRLLLPSLKYEKMKLLLNILVKTHAFDALVGLMAFIIAFSFMIPVVEPNITNFWDAMWYCFTVVTTIGFGDFYATTVVGRILTVVLGIYGIVVVAILTSVVVNFYNEVSKDKDKSDDFLE